MQTSPSRYALHLQEQVMPALAELGEAIPQNYGDAVMTLALLDVEPARPELEAGYSQRRGGRPHRDPVAIFRCLMLMALLGERGINAWAARLKREPLLVALCGFEQPGSPGVGTLYDFLGRLMDGPPSSPDRVRPSSRFKGIRFRRSVKKEKADRLAQTPAAPVKAAAEEALTRLDQKLPTDFAGRLQKILCRCAVARSAQEGLLGELTGLDVAIDGSLFGSHASGKGVAGSRVDDTRDYSDPQATWGYSKHRKGYVFGHRLHAIATKGSGIDLPLYLRTEAAHVSDAVMAADDLVRFKQLLREELPGVQVATLAADTGYDATALYAEAMKLGIKPVIPLHPNSVKSLALLEDVPRNEAGTPLCRASLAMYRLGYNKQRNCITFHCPVKRRRYVNGVPVYEVYPEQCPFDTLCRPETPIGPTVNLKPDDDPRLNVVIARDSERWAELMAGRTCVERLFGWLKGARRLGRRSYRRQHILASMATVHAMLAHASAWLDKLCGQSRNWSAASLANALGQHLAPAAA